MEDKTGKKPKKRASGWTETWSEGIREQKNRREKQKKWEAHLKETMSPEQYQIYLEREKKRRQKIFAGAAGGVLIAAVLIVGAVWKTTGSVKDEPAFGLAAEDDGKLEAETENRTVYPEKDITIGSTGSVLLHSPFLNSYADAAGEYDFSSIFQYITSYYSAVDFMTCEFEGALGGPEMGYSGYPNFKSPDAIVKNIRDSGVDLQMIATNHMYDGLSSAFHRTMEVYETNGIHYTGARRTSEDKPYYIADVDGVTIGFMDYVYETKGSGVNLNGIPLEQQDWDLVNSFDYNDLDSFYQEADSLIQQMQEDGARFIVANMHWGTEYQLKESSEQRTIAQKLCDLGVDALIGGHPHCIQPIDVFETPESAHKMFCIFSEGNALCNQRKYLMMNEMPNGHTEDGVMVTLSLHQDAEGTVSITDVDILPTWVYRFQNNGSKYYILPLDDAEHLAETTGITDLGDDPQCSRERTLEVLGEGLEKAKSVFQS